MSIAALLSVVIIVNTAHALMYLRLNTRNPFRFLALCLLLELAWPPVERLAPAFPMAAPVIMMAYVACGAWLTRLLVSGDNFSRIFFCLSSVFAFSQFIRVPPMLIMMYGLGRPAPEASRAALFIYPLAFILLSPLLFRYVRGEFRRILDIAETQKWYLVGLFPLLLATIGELILAHDNSGMLRFSGARSIAVLLPLCTLAYFISLYMFLVNYRDKQLLRQELAAAGRLAHAYEFYGRELEEKEARLRAMRHDFRHLALHLGALAKGGDLEGLTRELQVIAKNRDEAAVTAFSENATVNAVVSFHFAVAGARGVACTAQALVPAELAIPKAELSLLLGNALENCVKGAGPLGGTGYISFTARPVKGYMLFVFENNYAPEAYATGEKVGLASIGRLCERLHGRLEVTDSGDRFTLKAFVSSS